MDRRRLSPSCTLLLILCVISSNSKVILGKTSVLFIQNSNRQYVRQPTAKADLFYSSEVGAAASVLLGFAPPSLGAASSSKLNEVLMPNPFDRPRAMFILEVTGVEDMMYFPIDGDSSSVSAVRISVEAGQAGNIQIPGEDELHIFSLDGLNKANEFTDKEISDLASWLGGSYSEDKSSPLSGELIIPAAKGDSLRLHMSEGSDKKFVIDLLLLVNGLRDAMDTHQVLKNRAHRPAELIIGRFDGIQVLQHRYGKEGIAQKALNIVAAAIFKAFSSLSSSYDGRMVGVIGYGYQSEKKLENMFQVSIPSKSVARALQETNTSQIAPEVAEALFVRTTLTWITGIILLIATLLGVYFLLNMPLTKDTLLYSNVKLD